MTDNKMFEAFAKKYGIAPESTPYIIAKHFWQARAEIAHEREKVLVEALENIIKHQEIVCKSAVELGLSTTAVIAKRALNQWEALKNGKAN